MKILLVDDDAFLRDMYATKFTEQGDSVVAVSGSREAVTAFRSGEFDVVVMDMVMPEMSGVELIKQLRAIKPDQRCIVLSNQSEPFDKQAAAEVGADGYLVKANLVPSEVVERVSEIIKSLPVK